MTDYHWIPSATRPRCHAVSDADYRQGAYTYSGFAGWLRAACGHAFIVSEARGDRVPRCRRCAAIVQRQEGNDA